MLTQGLSNGGECCVLLEEKDVPDPIVSIVTVTYSDDVALTETLTSLESQIVDHSAIEHVVIDGASLASTRQAFEEYAPCWATLVQEPDNGIYDAMNKGTRHTRADYLLYLNAGDCFADANSLAGLVNVLREKRPTWLVAGALNLHGGTRPPSRINNLPHRWWRHALGLQQHCHQSTVFSRRLVESLGGYALDYGLVGDFDFIMRAGLVGAPEEFSQIVVRYQGGGRSAQISREIPGLLSRVRRERMALSGAVRAIDSAWARWRRLRLDIHLAKKVMLGNLPLRRAVRGQAVNLMERSR